MVYCPNTLICSTQVLLTLPSTGGTLLVLVLTVIPLCFIRFFWKQLNTNRFLYIHSTLVILPPIGLPYQYCIFVIPSGMEHVCSIKSMENVIFK